MTNDHGSQETNVYYKPMKINTNARTLVYENGGRPGTHTKKKREHAGAHRRIHARTHAHTRTGKPKHNTHTGKRAGNDLDTHIHAHRGESGREGYTRSVLARAAARTQETARTGGRPTLKGNGGKDRAARRRKIETNKPDQPRHMRARINRRTGIRARGRVRGRTGGMHVLHPFSSKEGG